MEPKKQYVSVVSPEKRQLIPVEQATPAASWLQEHPRLNSVRRRAI